MDLNKLLKSQWDRAAAIGLTVLGAVFLIVGWVGVSGTPYLAEQAPYIVSGGIGGVFLLGVGATLWVSADLRDEWRKLDRIETAIGEGQLRWSEDDAPVAGAPRTVATHETPVLPTAAVIELDPVVPLPATVPAAKAARTASSRSAAATATTRTRRPATRPRVKASTNDA